MRGIIQICLQPLRWPGEGEEGFEGSHPSCDLETTPGSIKAVAATLSSSSCQEIHASLALAPAGKTSGRDGRRH